MRCAECVAHANDGRLLSVFTAGHPEDDCVLVLHGTPGVREMFEPELEAGARRDLRYLSYSRPGFGGSDRHPGRSITDCVSDIGSIADQMGVERFYVIGESGGGPHALACAALLPDRVRAVALAASVAPIDAEGLEWREGMSKGNLKELDAAQKGPGALEEYLEEGIREFRSVETAAQLRAALDEHLKESDRVVLDSGFGAFLLAAWKRIAEDGIWGWFDDDLALYGDWGFEFGDVVAPVTVWQGDDDWIVPSSHGRWLAKNLPRADFRPVPGAGHISLVAENYGAILDAMILSGT